MKPQNTGEERRLPAGGDAFDAVRSAGTGWERAYRPGQGLATLEEGWFERARTARYPTTRAAASACRVSPTLMWRLECGGVTAPELAVRVGRAMGLSRAQVRALTCAKTVERRRRDAQAGRAEERDEGRRA